MSNALSKLLDQPEEIIKQAVTRLEAKNGWPSHDVRATAENIQKVRSKISQLGLDPNDTTAAELYHALLIKFQNDARRFDEHFGSHGQEYDQKIQKAVELVSTNSVLPDRWVLKTTAAKQLLRQHPPKRVMKQLGYRSVDSFVKREDTAEIYLAIEIIETDSWNKAHFKLASHLPTTAFERRILKLQALSSRWGGLSNDEIYVASGDYGVLGLLPSEEVMEMPLLGLVALLLDEAGAKTSETAKLSPTAAWWAETDELIAGLNDASVSLNLKDICLNHVAGAEVEEHHKATAQRHFWQELVSHYEHQPLIGEDNLPELTLPELKVGPQINQPAFEYVEDI